VGHTPWHRYLLFLPPLSLASGAAPASSRPHRYGSTPASPERLAPGFHSKKHYMSKDGMVRVGG
jgi:hypothetical protein